MRRFLFSLLIIALSFNASALIKAKLDLFELSAAIVRMKVVNTLPESNGIVLGQVEVTQGKYDGKASKLQLGKPQGLFEKIKKDAPAILFKSPRGDLDVLHIADAWLIVKLNDEKTAWISQGEKDDLYPIFPGATTSLEQGVINHKDGKFPILETLHENILFSDKPKPLGQAPRGATTVFSLHDHLIFNTPDGIRVVKPVKSGLLNVDEKFDGEAQGVFLKDLKTTSAVYRLNDSSNLEKIPGQWTLIDGKTLQNSLFSLDNLYAGRAALGQFLEQGKTALLTIDKEGLFIRPLDGLDKPQDFQRLTGKKWADILPENINASEVIVKTLDANSDNKDDALILWKTGGILLINRGYGCFFASETAVKNLRDSAKSAGATLEERQLAPTPWGMVLMDKTGKLTLIGNSEETD